MTVLPITSRTPSAASAAVSIPTNVKARIGLDDVRDAWVIVDEANVFAWPGFDLVPKAGGGFIRGVVTGGFFRVVREAILKQQTARRGRRIKRD